MKNLRLKICVILTLIISVNILSAQGTLDDYQRANNIDSLFEDKVFNIPRSFNWNNDHLLWYVNNTSEGDIYMLVDAEKSSRKVAFDHKKLAGKLSELYKEKVDPFRLKLRSLDFTGKGYFTFEDDSLKLKCKLPSYKLEVTGKVDKNNWNRGYWGNFFDEQGGKPVPSPDKKMTAFIRNSNVYVKDNQSKEEWQLSYDGSTGFYYSSHVQWSPDGKKLMAYKVRPGEDHKIYFVSSSPEDQLQPKLESRDYRKPGDVVPFRSPQLFDVATKKQLVVPTTLFDEQFNLGRFQWRKDSRAFTFEYNQRGHQVYKVLEVNATTGKVSVLVEEQSKTFIDYSGKVYRHDVNDGESIIWASERDGWNHLYRFDGTTGKMINQITKGNWPVREVIKVDDEAQRIYFVASGLDKDQDPYLTHYCSIAFDGSDFKRYTTENANHSVNFSEKNSYYVDQYSRVDMAPVTVLKDAKSGKVVMQLEKADISRLEAVGWKAPEVFSAKGRDGETDIWGIIIRPVNFSPEKSYPIIEYIYAGPHSSFVPKSFSAYNSRMHPLAELGFIVVQIDGMGTSNRSKAFHDVCWKNLKDAGFPDRKLWMKAAAAKYPYMNIDKVGIRGTSAGGQNAAAALVFNSDFYDVAVASCGCHDNRMDKIWWNEQWMGYPIGPQYAECSNIENAAQMEGNLMLIVGEVDDNVDPASTYQFANALIKANKDFELITVPGMGHSSGGTFGERKRRDFFVKHLLGVNPPKWSEVYHD
ncbi:S9 family peptidase [Robertkochia solimangrovi]|uniref:S9 family peptidase n=1 Tax=Robertkochia solimangrovi TaxID=2213046 RepID=UPI00117DF8E7|nr:S9 family peptidase [Robertkochia solimangrovi]TRZ43511.1 S9 family peptidase [Robertkochia solimangrovi]